MSDTASTETVERARDLPILDPDIFTIGGDDPENVAALKGYLESIADQFLNPIVEDGRLKCLCGRSLTGFLGGTFTWGIAHGEGYCSECGWPARLYHFVNLPDGTRERVNALLLYRPSCPVQQGDGQ